MHYLSYDHMLHIISGPVDDSGGLTTKAKLLKTNHSSTHGGLSWCTHQDEIREIDSILKHPELLMWIKNVQWAAMCRMVPVLSSLDKEIS